jgi:hypothetical protein
MPPSSGQEDQAAQIPLQTIETTASLQEHHLIPNRKDFDENIDDVDISAHRYVWKRHWLLYTSSIVASIVMFVVLFWLEIIYFSSSQYAQYLGNSDNNSGWSTIIFSLPLLVFLVPVSVYSYFKSQMRRLFWHQIAEVISFTYQGKADPSGFEGIAFKEGHGRKMTDLLTGSYEGYPMRIYNYTATLGYGKGSYSANFTVFELTFGSTLPEILLNPISVEFVKYGPGQTLQGFIASNMKSISLEGNFNDFFELYIPSNYDFEIREIFQPDLMAELIDKYRDYAIEINGEHLYVMASPAITTKSRFLATYDLVGSLFPKIRPSLKDAAEG